MILRVEPGDDGGLNPSDPQGEPLPDVVVVEPGDDQVESAVVRLVLVGEARLVADQRDRLAGERAALPVADVPENDVPVIDAVLGGSDRRVGGDERERDQERAPHGASVGRAARGRQGSEAMSIPAKSLMTAD